MKITFNLSRILAISILLLCLSSPSFASVSSPLLPEGSEEAVSLSIQLNKRTIQASSTEEQIFPMMISSKINKLDLSSFPRNPVDLVFVFEIKNDWGSCRENRIHQIKEIQDSLKDLRPLMTDQDRLAIVVFARIGYHDNLMDVSNVLPSLINTTTQNWEKIIETIGEKMVKQSLSAHKALEIAKEVLNQREETSRTTGVFISTSSDLGERYPDYCSPHLGYQTMEEIDWAKKSTGIKEKNWIIQVFQGEPKEHSHGFAESMAALRAGIVETQLLIKPEESEILKDVQIDNTYFLPDCTEWAEENGAVLKRSLSAKSGMEEKLFFDLTIPRIAAQDLLSVPKEVKVASFQLVFFLNNGSQVVVKNADLTLKIVGEGEEILDGEESREVLGNFYNEWASRLIRSAWWRVVDGDYEKALKILKRYQESLDGSIMKNDETLQKLWKDAEGEILWDQENGVEHDW